MSSLMSTDSEEDVFVDALEFLPPSELETLNLNEPNRNKNFLISTNNDYDNEPLPLALTPADYKASIESLGVDSVQSYPSAADAEANLDSDIQMMKFCIQLFMNSKFQEAEREMKKRFKRSFYFTHGYATLMTIKSLMTFDPADLRNALALIQEAVAMSSFYRKKEGTFFGNISSIFRGQSLDNMNRLQRHAELMFAEGYLLKAVLTIINDESFVAFIREGINIRNAYMIYKQCLKWLNKQSQIPTSSDSNDKPPPERRRIVSEPPKVIKTSSNDGKLQLSPGLVDEDFASGVRFGIGLFNVMFSLLPSRVLKVFEAIGFSGSRKYGLQQLNDRSVMNGLRKFLCELALLGYHTVLGSLVLYLHPDLELSEEILARELVKHPEGSIYIFFQARLFFARGRLEEAVPFYQKSIHVQSEWRQLHHICYWDMGLCHLARLNFLDAAVCMDKLLNESRWSKAVYSYMLATYLYMANDLKQPFNNNNRSSSSSSNVVYSKERVDSLMESVEGKVQKIAGKRIPLEKFVSRKSRKYEMQDGRLFLPALELMIVWNLFETCGMSLSKVLDIVDEKLRYLRVMMPKKGEKMPTLNDAVPELNQETGLPKSIYATYWDDYCLGLLIKATTLREMQLLDDSLKTYQELLEHGKKIVLDHYVVPYAHLELGRLYLMMIPQKRKEARQNFEGARNNFKKFSLENSLHFRVHNAIKYLDQLENKNAEVAVGDE